MKDLERWMKAVVHLEAVGQAPDPEAARDAKRMASIAPPEAASFYDATIEDYLHGDTNREARGTAIFIRHDGGLFLVTATHVLRPVPGMRWPRILARHYDHMSPEDTVGELLPPICDRFARVFTYDEVLAGKKPDPLAVLSHLAVGSHDTRACSFSEDEYDLAVISLNRDISEKFVDDLIASGFEPIESDVFCDQPSVVGTEVCAIGFPGRVSIIGREELHAAEIAWASSVYSLPTATFGRVAMYHEHLEYLWADLSCYGGMSGGPVVGMDSGRLVGILSNVARGNVEKETESGDWTNLCSSLPFAKITKSKYLMPLIRQQMDKDACLSALRSTAIRGRATLEGGLARDHEESG